MKITKRIAHVTAALAMVLALGGCGSMFGHGGIRQAGSIVDYLYPDAKEAPNLQPTVTRLRLPVRVGIAFVPGGGLPGGVTVAWQAHWLGAGAGFLAAWQVFASPRPG